jgi:hemin uptake protein HemP
MTAGALSCRSGAAGGGARPAVPLPSEAVPLLRSTPSSWQSQDLLGDRKAVEIIHDGLVYRLQATRLGKLILTK